MADTPTPYVRKDPGDIMLAADWNQMQVRARQEIQAHDHSGDPFQQIPREGIREKAIDGSRIDPDAKVALKGLTVSGPLKITGTSQLADIKAALASFTGARLTTAGDLGVGTDAPENAEGWSRVVDILGGAHAKLAVRAGDVDARVMAHTAGIYGGEPGMLVGTRSGHPLSLVQAGTVRARLAPATAAPRADVRPPPPPPKAAATPASTTRGAMATFDDAHPHDSTEQATKTTSFMPTSEVTEVATDVPRRCPWRWDEPNVAQRC